jgi:hypothetical protein
MFQKLRLAGLLVCLFILCSCSGTIRPFGADRNIPEPRPVPPRVLGFTVLPNLVATSIGCRVRGESAHIVGHVANNSPVAAGAFVWGGTAVSGDQTTQLPDGISDNVVHAGLAANSTGPNELEVFLADFPLGGPQGWSITFIVDPPYDQHPGGDLWELNEQDNVVTGSCSCARDPTGAGYFCTTQGGP